jgi:hypothetical protein
VPFARARDARTTPARPSGPAAHPEPDDRPTPAYPLKNPPKGEALETIEGPETEARPTVAIRKRKPRLAGEQPTLTGKESVEQVSELPSVDELLEGPVPLSPGVFARMLSGLSLRRATGELRVKRAPLVKVLGLKEGALCFAASNVGAERLSRFAVEQGKVPADRLAELKERVQKGARTGEALVAMGLVSETERAELVARLVREIAWSMLDATAGELRFAAQAPERKNLLPMSLDPLPLLVEGYRALPLLRLRELFDRGRLYFRVAEPAWTAGQLGLSEKESHLLAAADGSKKIEDLALLSELGERECLAVVTALTHLGLLEGRAPAGREPVLV